MFVLVKIFALDPDPYSFSIAGSRSVTNEYGSETLEEISHFMATNSLNEL